MVNGGTQAMGINALYQDMGREINIELGTAPSAAKGIAARKGLGKVRHTEVCQLWLQERVRKGDIKIVKVGTHENVADALTKYVSRSIMDMHTSVTGQSTREGRHALAPATEC